MNDEVIITCALTGAGDTVGVHPAIPVTPEQIADAAIEAAKAGAAVAHVHVRDPDTGAIAHDVDLFREVVERIRESDTDVVINLTAGGGGDLFLADDDPTVAAPGTDIQTPEERHAPIAECLPEICSLDCGSYNFADGVYVDPAPWVRRHAKLIQEAGVRPELECFDLGHIWLAKQLIAEGLVDDPAWFQLCVGVRWGAEATPETLLAMRNMLPEGAQWTALGVGRHQMPIAAQAVLLGGNVRVGLEDNLYLEKGVFASNGQLVEKAVSIVEHLGARVLTPEETRAKLGLRRHG
jgi:uncharacterized protein (DUF849 family)